MKVNLKLSRLETTFTIHILSRIYIFVQKEYILQRNIRYYIHQKRLNKFTYVKNVNDIISILAQ